MVNKSINIISSEKLILQRLEYVIDFINNHPLKPAHILFTLNASEFSDINISLWIFRKNQILKFQPEYFFHLR
ncbi:MAG: hypothetical protein R2771_09455 [Saprospiraceae bacterium]